jgi:hypothetical protein
MAAVALGFALFVTPSIALASQAGASEPAPQSDTATFELQVEGLTERGPFL